MALHLWILPSYSFSIVAETLSTLEQHAFLLSRSWRSGVLKSRGGRPAFLPEEFSGDGLFPGLSQLPEAPSSIVAVSLFNPLSLHAKHRPKGPFHWWSRGRVVLVFSFPFFFSLVDIRRLSAHFHFPHKEPDLGSFSLQSFVLMFPSAAFSFLRRGSSTLLHLLQN